MGDMIVYIVVRHFEDFESSIDSVWMSEAEANERKAEEESGWKGLPGGAESSWDVVAVEVEDADVNA